MSETQRSYLRRNIALGVVAGLIVIAAAVRLTQGPPAEPASTAPTESPTAPMAAPEKPLAEALPGPAAPDSTAAGGAAIEVEVSYAGAVDALPATAKVYVFIRPVGERMPLGVQTYDVRDLPVQVDFSAPSVAAAAQTVEVVARLSMTGAVSLQGGDLELVSDPLQFGVATPRISLALGAKTSSIAAAQSTTAGNAAANAPVGSFGIPVHLALGAGVRLPATTTVFLILRASGGGPMPLAVKRMTVGDLPTELVLSDADAMVAGRSLRDAGSVELVARASVSGNVKAGPGDYEGSSGALRVEAISTPIELLIDRAL